jgi:MerR HTH family regulatory protein
MARKEGNGFKYRLCSMRSDRKRLNYFYINDKLHKIITVSRPRDEVLAWCYTDHCKKIYQWSHIRKYAEAGYSPKEAAELVNRTTRTLRAYLYSGMYRSPERVYNLETGAPGKRIYSESDIHRLQDLIMTQHCGRPRADGIIKPKRTSTKQELYARLKHDVVLYTKTPDGKFVPVYAAEDW